MFASSVGNHTSVGTLGDIDDDDTGKYYITGQSGDDTSTAASSSLGGGQDGTSSSGRNSLLLESSVRSNSSNAFERSSQIFSEDTKKRLGVEPSKRKTNSLDDITINKLNFDKVDLMGRDKEVKILQNAFDKAAGKTVKDDSSTTASKKQLILLSGYSGVGKTRLARSLRQSVKKNKNGLYAEGKFDQNNGNNKPYSALSSVCGMICATILACEQADHICNTMATALGSEIKLLLSALPVLEEILQNREFQNDLKEEDENSRSGTGKTQSTQRPEEAKFRLNFAFCRFLRVVSQFFAPIVMVLDDLQWADVPSLDLLQDILGDRDNTKMVVVGIYRSNEVDDGHVFSSVMRVLRKRSSQSTDNVFDMQEMEVGNLDFDAILSFLQDLLGTTDNSTMWLASACQKKTHGNVFFMIHFLIYIYSKHLLQYNFGLMKWQWSEEEIENNTMASDNVVDFLLQKMKDMSQEQNDALRLAACLGATFSERHMTLLWKELQKIRASDKVKAESDELNAALDSCILDGYLYESSSSVGTIQYVFVHDKVQEAAQLLTRYEEMTSFQNWVGETLLEALSPEELGSVLFTVVNLLNEGMWPIVHSRRIELAHLNYQTCVAAMKASAFPAVSRHTAIGIQLLGEGAFENHQKLALDLFSIGASAESCLGNLETMEQYCQAVMQRSDLPIEDKLPVYNTWLDSLANRGEFVKAINDSLDLLKQFHTRFPRNRTIQSVNTLGHIIKIKKDVDNGMLKKIMDLPMEKDPTRAQLVHLMDRLSVYLFYCNDDLMPLVMIRNLKWTFKYGLNAISPVSLTTMGLIFAGIMGDLKTGSDCARAALDLIPRSSPLVEGRILFVAHGFGYVWTNPMREQLAPFRKGYASALCAGDKESACWSIYSFCMYRFLTSFSLDLIIEDTRCYLAQMLELNQLVSYRSMLSHFQMFMNLAGRTETDPLSVTGDFLTKEDHETWMAQDPFYVACYSHWKCYTLTIFGEYEECAKLAIEHGHYFTKTSNPGCFQICLMEAFSKGISSFVAARTASEKKMRNKFRKNAMAIRKRVKDWIGKGCPNVSHLNLFFDAELAALQGKRHDAIQSYQIAIILAGRGGWMTDAGYFSEIFAEYLLQLGEKDDAIFRLQEALKYFREFGAMRKVHMLETKHAALLSLQSRSIDVVVKH